MSENECKKTCEVFSRVVGYHRPVSLWNIGKKEEFKDRREYNLMVSLKNPCMKNKQR